MMEPSKIICRADSQHPAPTIDLSAEDPVHGRWGAYDELDDWLQSLEGVMTMLFGPLHAGDLAHGFNDHGEIDVTIAIAYSLSMA
jgi:hypothetical protein